MKILHSINDCHGNKVQNNQNRYLPMRATVLSTGLTICITLAVSGCGQRGNLYIPTAPEAAQRSTIGDILIKPTPSPAPETNKPSSTTPSTTPAPAK